MTTGPEQRGDGTDASLSAQRDADDPLLGVTLEGKFRLEELIGAGAMGRVYRARHLALDSDVAVKVLRPERATSRESIARFRHEARATSRLRHPSIITILDFGQMPSGQMYLVTELLEGRTLGEVVREDGPLAPRRIANLLGQALSALDAAHAAGVVHRDLKLENIHVTTVRGEEQVKVLDFGLAHMDETRRRTTVDEGGDEDEASWSRGRVVGTPDTMAPEQIRSEPLDARCDIYSLGVVLYVMLTGARPFDGDLLDVLKGHLHQPPMPPQLRRPDLRILPALETVCLRAMAKRREDRYASAAEMREALLASVDDATVRCSGCGAQVPALTRECPDCGATMAERSAFGVELPLRFVGREEELARLVSRDVGVVQVVGRRGSGRTRLVEEWRARMEALGHRVLLLRPDPSGARRAWWPVREALAEVLGFDENVPEDLARAIEKGTWAHPEDAPGLREIFGVGVWSQGEPAVDEEPDRRELRRREALAAAALTLRECGMALVCEDVDRWDALSLEVASRLCQDPGPHRLVLTTTDEAPVDAGSAVEEVKLGPLGPRAQAALGVPELESQPAVWPLELEQSLRARGENAQATPAARLGALPAAARRALAAVVVAGREIDLVSLGRVTGRDLRGPLGTLAARGLVRFVDDAHGERVVLPSPSLRDELYGALDADARSWLHTALRNGVRDADHEPELLAHHEWLAEPTAAALEPLEAAARHAEDALDDEGAARWYHRARTRVAKMDAMVAARVSLSLGEARRRVGDLVGAAAALEDALSLSSGDLAIAARARRGLGHVAIASRDAARAASELDQALPLASGEPALAARIAIERAALSVEAGHADEALPLLRSMLPHARSHPTALARLFLAIASAAAHAGKHDEAVLSAEAALEPDDTPPLERARALTALARLSANDDRDTALHYLDGAVLALRALGDRRALAELLLDAAAFPGTDPLAARHWLADAAQLARQVGWLEGRARALDALDRME